ncbi:MAG: MFS transporter, partial [Acidimicrobiales bacterium]
QWVVNAYTLAFASLMLGAGLLGDRFGRKKVMLAGVAVFCAGSVVAATAPNVSVLIVGRAIMGMGAAASEPGTLSVLRHIYPEDQTRARALGVWAAVSGLAIALGPVVGGLLIGISGWRAVFWFNLVAGIGAGIAAARTVPDSADPATGPLDVAGITLGVLALVAVTFGIIQGEVSGFSSPWILALLVGAGACAVAFVAVERRSRDPLLDLRYFRHGSFSGAVVVAFAVSFGLFTIFFFIALYLQLVKNYSGYHIAVEFLPMALVMVIGALWTGRWVARVGPGAPLAAGCALAGVGIVATRFVLGSSQGVALAATLAVAGLGIGTAIVPVTAVALGEVPPERSGMAASTANTSRVLGALFAVALLGALMNAHLTTDLKHKLHALGVPNV